MTAEQIAAFQANGGFAPSAVSVVVLGFVFAVLLWGVWPCARPTWAGPTTDERERIRVLEREMKELRQANEILRKASAYFAQAELDRRFKP